jgi:hypothetical protein
MHNPLTWPSTEIGIPSVYPYQPDFEDSVGTSIR